MFIFSTHRLQCTVPMQLSFSTSIYNQNGDELMETKSVGSSALGKSWRHTKTLEKMEVFCNFNVYSTEVLIELLQR